MLSSTTKARLRLALVATALVPLALVARAFYSEHLTDRIARAILNAWMRYDKSTGRND